MSLNKLISGCRSTVLEELRVEDEGCQVTLSSAQDSGVLLSSHIGKHTE